MLKVYASQTQEYPDLAINLEQLEKEICNKANKRNIFLAHDQQVACIAENELSINRIYVTCYAASKQGKQKKIAVYTLHHV